MVRMKETLLYLPYAVIVLGLIVVAGELAARLDDWAFQRVPICAQVDRERDLMFHDAACVRGRPHGLFKKYRLNEFGFRGPEINRTKAPGTKRVLFLGASETFGLYESEGREFAEQLRRTFFASGEPIEIVNAAVAGMTLPSLTAYWEHWVKNFGADLVLIYPSPQFYLDNEMPAAVHPDPDRYNHPPRFKSRFLSRLSDTLKQVDFVKRLRVNLLLWRQLKGKDASWIFRAPPQDRLNAFSRDLTLLGESIAKSGAKPVLVTHAFKNTPPLSHADEQQLQAFRIFFPRSELVVMPLFDAEAAQKTLAAARAKGWPSIDVSSQLSGRRELFADPTHFNDKGSEAMAHILAPEIRNILTQKH